MKTHDFFSYSRELNRKMEACSLLTGDPREIKHAAHTVMHIADYSSDLVSCFCVITGDKEGIESEDDDGKPFLDNDESAVLNSANMYLELMYTYGVETAERVQKCFPLEALELNRWFLRKPMELLVQQVKDYVVLAQRPAEKHPALSGGVGGEELDGWIRHFVRQVDLASSVLFYISKLTSYCDSSLAFVASHQQHTLGEECQQLLSAAERLMYTADEKRKAVENYCDTMRVYLFGRLLA